MTIVEDFGWESGLIGISLTAFTLINVLTKPYRFRSDWLLCLWLILLNIPFLHSVLSHLNVSFSGVYRFTNPTLNLLHGPVLYLYVRTLTSSTPAARLRTTDVFHFAPFVLLYALFISMSHPEPMLPQPDRINSEAGPVASNGVALLFEPLMIHFGWINVLVFLVYSGATIYRLIRHQKSIKDIFSQSDNQISLRWIYALPGMFTVLVVINVIIENFFAASVHPVTLHMFSFLCFTILLCFFGINQKPVFHLRNVQTGQTEVDADSNEQESDANITPPHSEHSDEASNHGLSNESINQIIDEMQTYMKRERPYLDPDFSVYVLAEKLSIPRRTLSQVLNTGLSKNFYQYVNEFRIEEVKSQLERSDRTSTILDIAYEAGFKSKSSFNSLFKQYSGVTPSQYRKNCKPEG